MIVAAITALDVAFIGSIAALAAAIVAPLTTWVIASSRNRHERWSRIYEDRRDAYLAILRVGFRTSKRVQEHVERLEHNAPGDPERLPGETEETAALLARVRLFATRPVIDQMNALYAAEVAVYKAIRDVDASNAETLQAGLAAARKKRDELRRALDDLGDTVHAEIAKTI